MENRIIYENDTMNVYLSGKYSNKKFNELKRKISLIKNSYGITNISFIYNDHEFEIHEKILDK